MQKRILLINPNFQENISSLSQISVGPPLGLGYIASMLKKHDVRILDANALGYSLSKVLKYAGRFSPDYIGITSTTATINICLRYARKLKENNSQVKIVLGGIHPTYCFKDIMSNNPVVDFIILGEGEIAFPALIEAKDFSKVNNLVWRNNSKIVKNKQSDFFDIANLPFPARELLPNQRYSSIEFENFTTIIAMRGCPASCIYCSVPSYCGKKLRIRKPFDVVNEIEECIEKYGVKCISFLDDTFTYNREWVVKFCNLMIEKKLNTKVKWFCLTRVDCVDLELLKLMKYAGCFKLEFGIESGSEKTLRKIGKSVNLKQIKSAFKLAKRLNLVTMAFVMVGFPWETRKDILETKKLVLEINPDFIQVSFPTPYPATPFYEYCKKRNLILSEDYSRYSFLNNIVIKNEVGLGNKDINSLKKSIERAFYLNPIRFLKISYYLILKTDSIKLLFKRLFLFLREI